MITLVPRRWALSLGALLAVATLAPAVPAQNANVWVVHGIRGEDVGLGAPATVDIEVNGACLIKGFQFRDVAGPLSLPPGTYDINVRQTTDSVTCNGPIIIPASVPIGAGENVTIIAHIDESGAPTASKFLNDVSPSTAGSRIQFHHTAAAPAVDIRTRSARRGSAGLQEFLNVTNGQQGGAEYAPGTYYAAVFLAGTELVALGPVKGSIEDMTLYSVYVVGSATNETLTTITVEQSL